MVDRAELSMARMIVGAGLGATVVGWRLWLDNLHALYWSLWAGHVAVIAGFVLSPSHKRMLITLASTILMWWPAPFSDLIWTKRCYPHHRSTIAPARGVNR
ncbi:MAG: hypothetical protein OXD50_04235 [Chloroflexi bacterium]|nr:hypothetical protein [Chloroflexota bacterium]